MPDQGPSVLPTAMENHLETVDFAQSDPQMVRIISRITFASLKPTQDETAPETKMDILQKVSTEVRQPLSSDCFIYVFLPGFQHRSER